MKKKIFRLMVSLVAVCVFILFACGGKSKTSNDDGCSATPEVVNAVDEYKNTELKMTEPKETMPEETEPKETEPGATELKETKPEVTEPEATEPKETEPEVTETEATEPEATEPETTELQESESKEFKDRCCLTFAEGGICDLEEQICLSAIVINREESDRFPKQNDFNAVKNQKGQFSTVKSGKIYNNGKEVKYDIVPETTRDAVRRALNGEDPTEQLLWDKAVSKGLDPEYYAEGGALFFMTNACFKSMGLKDKVKVYVDIGHHTVFKIWG